MAEGCCVLVHGDDGGSGEVGEVLPVDGGNHAVLSVELADCGDDAFGELFALHPIVAMSVEGVVGHVYSFEIGSSRSCPSSDAAGLRARPTVMSFRFGGTEPGPARS